MVTNEKKDHYSKYRLTFKSGSNVYPEIHVEFMVHFAYPLSLRVEVDGETVLYKIGTMGEHVTIEKNYPCQEGYYINSYDVDGGCLFDYNKELDNYEFTFIREDVVVRAVRMGISYKLEFEKNGDPLKNGEDVLYSMFKKTMIYGAKAVALPKNSFVRKGYTFKGWNTMPDGSGRAFADKEKVQNLTTTAGEVIHLYAQWEPNATTTASIFSKDTTAIYIGSGTILLSLIGSAVCIANRNKKKWEAV
jgi:uncharacterized repeat protein (TIGR02543 family)